MPTVGEDCLKRKKLRQLLYTMGRVAIIVALTLLTLTDSTESSRSIRNISASTASTKIRIVSSRVISKDKDCSMPLKYSEDFEKAAAFVLSAEKGYKKWHSKYGGETNWGITKKWYPNEDIKNMTPERAKKIYFKDYWLKTAADTYAYPHNMIILDTAILMGPTKTNQLKAEAKDWQDFLRLRREHIDSVKSPLRKGWHNRTNKLEKVVLESIRNAHPVSGSED